MYSVFVSLRTAYLNPLRPDSLLSAINNPPSPLVLCSHPPQRTRSPTGEPPPHFFPFLPLPIGGVLIPPSCILPDWMVEMQPLPTLRQAILWATRLEGVSTLKKTPEILTSDLFFKFGVLIRLYQFAQDSFVSCHDFCKTCIHHPSLVNLRLISFCNKAHS